MRTIESRNLQISETGAILNTLVTGTIAAKILLFTLVKNIFWNLLEPKPWHDEKIKLMRL